MINEFYLWVDLLLLLAFMIVFHEIGHWAYFKYIIKKDIKVKAVRKGFFMDLEAGNVEDYQNLTNLQYCEVNIYGVVFGLIPLILWAGFNNSVFYLCMLIPYGYGCKHDLTQAYKAYKNGI